MRTPILTLGALAILAAACGSDDSTTTATPTPVFKIVTFKTTMAGTNEVPANATAGTGTFTATLETSTNVFTYDFASLPGATLGATAGTAHGTAVLNAATTITNALNGDSLKKLLFAGLTYANIHTIANTGGEIRGQITKQ